MELHKYCTNVNPLVLTLYYSYIKYNHRKKLSEGYMTFVFTISCKSIFHKKSFKRKKTNKGNKWIYRMNLAATRISRSCQSKRLYGIQQMLLGLEQLTRILFPKRSWEREAL